MISGSSLNEGRAAVIYGYGSCQDNKIDKSSHPGNASSTLANFCSGSLLVTTKVRANKLD